MSICKVETKKVRTKGGRSPVVLSEKQIKEVEELASNMIIVQIASYLGISESTFHRMRESNFDILTAYKKGRARKFYKYAKTLENKAAIHATKPT
jgi:DNA-binding CsgD family transcriptional regulator